MTVPSASLRCSKTSQRRETELRKVVSSCARIASFPAKNRINICHFWFWFVCSTYVWSQSECSEGWCPSTWPHPPRGKIWFLCQPTNQPTHAWHPTHNKWLKQIDKHYSNKICIKTSNWATWPRALAALLPNCWLAKDLWCSSSVTALNNARFHFLCLFIRNRNNIIGL